MSIANIAPRSVRTLWVLGADRAFFVAVVILSLFLADRIAQALLLSGVKPTIGL